MITTAPAVAIIMGETAGGKSALAVTLAQRWNAEIIGADSRQIYHGMEIGTAAPTIAERGAVPHHLVGFLPPDERYSAARFSRDAQALLGEIFARGRRAVIVGGTGFYIRTLTGEMQLGRPAAFATRERVRREERLHDAQWLYEWLQIVDPTRARALHANDAYRVGQALERALQQRSSEAADDVDPAPAPLRVAYQKYWLRRPVEEVEERIIRRVDAMLAAGFIEEAERIGLHAVAASAVGYDCIFAYLRGQSTSAELRSMLVRRTRQYAKRQRTWLRRETNLQILDPTLGVSALADEMAAKLGWRPSYGAVDSSEEP